MSISSIPVVHSFDSISMIGKRPHPEEDDLFTYNKEARYPPVAKKQKVWTDISSLTYSYMSANQQQ